LLLLLLRLQAYSRLSKDLVRDKSTKLELSVVVYFMAVLDYVSADVLKLAGNYARCVIILSHFPIILFALLLSLNQQKLYW
jgi:hypothetical protein